MAVQFRFQSMNPLLKLYWTYFNNAISIFKNIWRKEKPMFSIVDVSSRPYILSVLQILMGRWIVSNGTRKAVIGPMPYFISWLKNI